MFAENGVTRLLLMLLLPVLGMAALAEENPPKESIISAANLHGR